MKTYLNLDKDGYLLSISSTNTGGPSVITLEGLDLSGHRLGAHRWDGSGLVLDEDKLAQMEANCVKSDAAVDLLELRRELVSTHEALLEGLEELLTVDNAVELVKVLGNIKKNLAGVLEDRAAIREKIAELSNK